MKSARKGMCTEALKLSIKALRDMPPDSEVNILCCVALELLKEALKYRKLKKKR